MDDPSSQERAAGRAEEGSRVGVEGAQAAVAGGGAGVPARYRVRRAPARPRAVKVLYGEDELETVARAAAPAPVSARPTLSRPPRRALDATSACVQFARTAATVDTTTGNLGRSRQAAARTYGTPQLQALFDGAGEGRNREQETWQQHRARITATAAPVVDDAHDELAKPGTEQPRPGTPAAVTVTGTAHGADGWTAAIATYRLDCLTVHDPAAGWLVDDIAVQALPAPATR